MAETAERPQQVVCTNRRARRNYFIEQTWEAGLVLTGSEVKALRQGRANLSDAIKSAFGGFDKFLETFAKAAATRFGSGWAWLVSAGN